MKRFRRTLLLITIVFGGLILSSQVSAHPGRTDAYGCHTCRTNCSNWGLSYGEYHCHNAKSLPQPESPVTCTYGVGCRYEPKPMATRTSAPQPTPVKCQIGYASSLNNRKCIKLPDNSHMANDGKNVWLCNEGYLEKGNSCVTEDKPVSSPSLSPSPVKSDSSSGAIGKFFRKIRFWSDGR